MLRTIKRSAQLAAAERILYPNFKGAKMSDRNGSHFLIRFSVDSVKPHSTLQGYQGPIDS